MPGVGLPSLNKKPISKSNSVPAGKRSIMKTPLLKAAACCLLLTAAALTSLQAQVLDKTPLFHMSFDNVNGTNVINDGSGGAVMNGALYGATIVGGGRFGNALSVTGATASNATVRINNAIIP